MKTFIIHTIGYYCKVVADSIHDAEKAFREKFNQYEIIKIEPTN